MHEVTLALAILLGAGFLMAKIVQLARLPSVTGYICAGLVLGPSGLRLLTPDIIGTRLDHFSQIALMLIAFGIGEHLEIRKVRKTAREVSIVALFESAFAFFLVAAGSFFLSRWLGVGPPDWDLLDYVSLALLLGAVAIATAPASTLHVLREMKAAGPFASILMQVVALDNCLAIMVFGVAASVVHHVGGTAEAGLPAAVLLTLTDIFVSILMGVLTGLLIDFSAHHLHSRGEILTIGLSLLLLCGELARVLGFSPLLAGMAAGFVLVNRDNRDVRFFRALNAFETPVYVLFFTLAGVHLDLTSLAMAGVLGLGYFLLRIAGKIAGVGLAHRLVALGPAVDRNLGLGLMPQAGLAIGLLFLIKGDAVLAFYSPVITPVVLAGVLLAELSGPLGVKIALDRAGETGRNLARGGCEIAADPDLCATVHEMEGVQLVPWTWEKLNPPSEQDGVVFFGASHHATVAALARMTTILAHYHKATPCALRVSSPEQEGCQDSLKADSDSLFAIETEEVKNLGYDLDTTVVQSQDVAHGILQKAKEGKAKGIVLGYPLKETSHAFEDVVEVVAREAPCEVIVMRFSGILHTECILVPHVGQAELETLENVICALSSVGRHRITLFRLLSADATEEDAEAAERGLMDWAQKTDLESWVRCRVVATESRLETIAQEAARHDLVVMAASRTRGLGRFFFGSLAEGVARRCNRPMLIVHGSKPHAEIPCHEGGATPGSRTAPPPPCRDKRGGQAITA